MRRTFLFFLLLAFLFLPLVTLYADDPTVTESAPSHTQSTTQRVVDAALQPGTYQFAEKLVKLVGEGIDWYFDRLVIGGDASTLPSIGNAIVNGIGQGAQDFHVDEAVNSSLDAFDELTRKVWLKPFVQDVLQGTDVKVKPYMKGQMEYATNAFYEPRLRGDESKEDVLWTWTPGVSANFPFGDEKQYRIGTVYEARFLQFTKFDEHDDIGQSFGAMGNFNFPHGLYANVTEELAWDAARAGTLTAKRVEYFDQKVSPTAGINWREWTVEAEYENSHRRFDSSIYDIFEYDNNVITGRLYRNLAPDFRGFLEYNYSHYDYQFDPTRPGRYHQYRAGVTGKLSERTRITARAGYQDRSYESHDTEYDIPVGDIRLQHRLTSKTNLDFFFHRTTGESSFTNNRAYDEKRLQGGGTYLFNNKLRGRAGTSYTHRSWDVTATTGLVQIERRDIMAGAYAGFDYLFRPWLIGNVDYRYDRSNSNNSNFDYTNNSLVVGFTMPL